MTTPIGDVPDWQTLTAPQILAASQIDQPAGASFVIFSSVNPFRVWGAWLRMSLCTNASYVAAVLEIQCRLQDGAGNPLLDIACHVVAANQLNHNELSLSVPGFTPGFGGGTYNVQIVTSASAANVFCRVSGGVYYSVP